jgi:hypothetical protein
MDKIKQETTTPAVASLGALQSSVHSGQGYAGPLRGSTSTGLQLAALVQRHFGVEMDLTARPRTAPRRVGATDAESNYPPSTVPQGPQASAYQTDEAYKIYECLQDMPRCVESMQMPPDRANRKPLKGIIPFCMHHIDNKTFGGQCVLRQWGGTTMYSVYIGYNPVVVPIWFEYLAEIPDDQMQAIVLATVSGTGSLYAEGVYCLPPANCVKLQPALTQTDTRNINNWLAQNGEGGAPQGSPLNFLRANRSLAGFLLLRALAEAQNTNKQVLIWEDGGYLNPILDEAYDNNLTVDEFRTAHHIAPDSAGNQLPGTTLMTTVIDSIVVGTTELTRNGYDATRALFESRTYKVSGGYTNIPFFSIACSREKVMQEGDNIALACLDALDQILYGIGWSLKQRNVCVFGARGNLGRYFVKHLIDVQTDPGDTGRTPTIWGVDVKVGWGTDNSNYPAWAEGWKWDKAIDGIKLEVAQYRDLPDDVRANMEVLFGWSGGPVTTIQKEGMAKRIGTFDGKDLLFWLTSGTRSSLFLASGSTKTAEFEDAIAYLQALITTGTRVRENEFQVTLSPNVTATLDVYIMPDQLTLNAVETSSLPADAWKKITRSFGTMFVFNSNGFASGPSTKIVYLCANTMPINFLFYGTPTEIMDMTYAQVTSAAARLVVSKPEHFKGGGRYADGMQPTNWTYLGSQGVFEVFPADVPPKDGAGFTIPPSSGNPAPPTLGG